MSTNHVDATSDAAPCVMVIFGVTGDLTKRKLIPALINLAQDGMSVLFGKKFPPTSKVYFQFRLPDQSASVRLSGQVIWQDWNGRAGVQFVDVPKASRRLLNDFLSVNLPSQSEREQFSDVTVEMEEPLALATVSVAEQTHGSDQGQRASQTVATQPAPGQSVHSAGQAAAPSPETDWRESRRSPHCLNPNPSN